MENKYSDLGDRIRSRIENERLKIKEKKEALKAKERLLKEKQKEKKKAETKKRRKAYQRWRAALKRGHDVPISLYIENSVVRFTKRKHNKKYYVYKRQLQVALATPKWVDIESMSVFYENCPKGSQVDHIIPINGKDVCGLHVIWNLQYLINKKHFAKTQKDNTRNKHRPKQ